MELSVEIEADDLAGGEAIMCATAREWEDGLDLTVRGTRGPVYTHTHAAEEEERSHDISVGSSRLGQAGPQIIKKKKETSVRAAALAAHMQRKTCTSGKAPYGPST